jgi:hypothetical protein
LVFRPIATSTKNFSNIETIGLRIAGRFRSVSVASVVSPMSEVTEAPTLTVPPDEYVDRVVAFFRGIEADDDRG